MADKDLETLLQQVRAEWASDPNVISVWIGLKERAGQWVAGPTLVFNVRRKHATEEEIVAADSRPIPHTIDGVPTDVKVIRGTATWAGSRGTHCEWPLKGGVSTAPLGRVLPFPTSGGTLGGVCYYEDGQEMALSNAHVWGNALGCEIVQPIVPVSQFFKATVELLSCGPVIAYLLEGALPSVLTTVLSAAATGTWIAAIAADAKDPSRRGQEATLPAQPTELTDVETVHFAAAAQTLPLPGLPYQAAVSWEYSRHTDLATYPYRVEEKRANEHVLVRQHVWAEATSYSAGQTAQIRVMLEAPNLTPPDAFHVVVHLVPKEQPDQCTTLVLHPTYYGLEPPFLGVSLALGYPDTVATFPFQKNGFVFRAGQPGAFRDWWPRDNPDGRIALQFPDSGLTIELPLQAERADVQLAQPGPDPITLVALDAQGTVLESVTTPSRPGGQHLLKVHRPSISRLVLRGGSGMGLLRWVSLRTGQHFGVQPLYDSTHMLCYAGQHTIRPAAPRGTWRAMLSAQSVDTSPVGTPPLQAAATIGGIENAIIATAKTPCTLCMALDDMYVVV